MILDLVYAADMFSYDLPRMMEAVTEAVQAYAQLWADSTGQGVAAPGLDPGQESSPVPEAVDDDSSLQVNDVLFSLMSESDKLAELSRFMGKLRFAVEGADEGTAEEACQEITTLAKHLPGEFQVANLLSVARDTSPKSSKLAQLYLERCFRLSAGDYSSVQNLESEIQSLQAQD